MKLLFKNNTKYTKENYNAFLTFHKNKYGTRTLIKLGLIGLCLLYILLMNIIHLNWIAIAVFVATGLVVYLLNRMATQQQSRSNQKVLKGEKVFSFYFYENYIKVKGGRKFNRLRYFELKRVFETKEYFYLYLDEYHSLILSKDGFEVGTAEGFSAFMKKKFPLKYKKEK